MKNAARITILSLLVGMISGAPRAGAQDGSIEFVARATPSSGVEEPVRGFPFYLLSKSFEEIRQALEVHSINTIYTWDFRCRKKLLEKLGGSWDDSRGREGTVQ